MAYDRGQHRAAFPFRPVEMRDGGARGSARTPPPRSAKDSELRTRQAAVMVAEIASRSAGNITFRYSLAASVPHRRQAQPRVGHPVAAGPTARPGSGIAGTRIGTAAGARVSGALLLAPWTGAAATAADVSLVASESSCDQRDLKSAASESVGPPGTGSDKEWRGHCAGRSGGAGGPTPGQQRPGLPGHSRAGPRRGGYPCQ